MTHGGGACITSICNRRSMRIANGSLSRTLPFSTLRRERGFHVVAPMRLLTMRNFDARARRVKRAQSASSARDSNQWWTRAREKDVGAGVEAKGRGTRHAERKGASAIDARVHRALSLADFAHHVSRAIRNRKMAVPLAFDGDLYGSRGHPGPAATSEWSTERQSETVARTAARLEGGCRRREGDREGAVVHARCVGAVVHVVSSIESTSRTRVTSCRERSVSSRRHC